MLRAIAITALLAALAPGVARGSSWRWPVRGRVVGSFSVAPDAPYAAGQRRGIAVRAAPGAVVGSACAGRVVFAGSVGRAGPTLSVACGGGLRATYQGLASLTVHRGVVVMPTEPIAVLGSAGVLHLGARVERARGPLHRYVDPAALLGDGPPALPPLGRAPRVSRRAPPPDPSTQPQRVPFSLPMPVAGDRAPAPASPGRAPLVAWIGLALIASATPLGALWRSRRARHRRATVARRAGP